MWEFKNPQQCGKPHWFPSGERPEAGEVCLICEIIFCPVAYDHDDECGVCGWNG